MPGHRLTPDAQSDHIEIRRYNRKQWGSEQSKKYFSELRQTIRLLAESPTLGKLRSDLGSGVYSFPYVSHVIYYLLHEQRLVVFGVLHKRRVPFTHLVVRGMI